MWSGSTKLHKTGIHLKFVHKFNTRVKPDVLPKRHRRETGSRIITSTNPSMRCEGPTNLGGYEGGKQMYCHTTPGRHNGSCLCPLHRCFIRHTCRPPDPWCLRHGGGDSKHHLLLDREVWRNDSELAEKSNKYKEWEIPESLAEGDVWLLRLDLYGYHKRGFREIQLQVVCGDTRFSCVWRKRDSHHSYGQRERRRRRPHYSWW